MTYKPDVVYYHHPCTDGSSAVAVVYNYYEGKGGETIAYEPFDYGNMSDIKVMLDACRGKHVLFVDSCMKGEDMQALQVTAESITILDHHKTAEAQMVDFIRDDVTLDNLEKELVEQKTIFIYTEDRSGASLAYRFFYSDIIPVFIEYVEDVDLGKFELPNAHDFKFWSRSLSFEIDTYRECIWGLTREDMPDIFSKGAAIKAYVDQQLERIIAGSRALNIGKFVIPYVVTDYAFSAEAAGKLLDESASDIGIGFYFSAKGLGASIRSQGGADSTIIAKQFGGGGHRNAAGFNIEWDEVQDFFDATGILITTFK